MTRAYYGPHTDLCKDCGQEFQYTRDLNTPRTFFGPTPELVAWRHREYINSTYCIECGQKHHDKADEDYVQVDTWEDEGGSVLPEEEV
jgi:hypothetical protein